MMVQQRILVTGSAGLIGRAIVDLLKGSCAEIIHYDHRHLDNDARRDLRDPISLERAVKRATGIVHLGAVSRVAEGEDDPHRCWATNVEATRDLLQFALQCRERPWVVFASSREVYGQQTHFPVVEDAPLQPANTYARSKVAAERLVAIAREEGLRTATVRFSNVYGHIDDYSDRVVPAFAAEAARGGVLRIEGADNALDFTHVDDAADGLFRALAMLAAGEQGLPNVHLASGVRTTLSELAEIAVAEGAPGTKAVEMPRRSFAVREFYGDPARARSLLGWRAIVPLRVGFAGLVSAFARRLRTREDFLPIAREPNGRLAASMQPETLCLP